MTNRDSRPIPDGKGGYFIERIGQGAFERALEKADEVKILLNHNWSKILGSTKSNLILKEDVIGLRAHAEISDAEIVRKAKEKRIRGWSFRFFKAVADCRAQSDVGIPIRTIKDMEIDEVSLIDENMRPWYPSTTVEARAGEESNTCYEIRAEEFEADYIGFENDKKQNNSKLKEMIERHGGKV